MKGRWKKQDRWEQKLQTAPIPHQLEPKQALALSYASISTRYDNQMQKFQYYPRF